MSYVARSLGPGEVIVHVARISWVTYVWSIVVGAIGVFLWVYAWRADLAPIWLYAGAAVFVLGFIWFLVVRLRNGSIELAVTNHKVVAKEGLLARNTIEQRLEKIDAIDVEQSVLGRIFGYGDVTIHGTGVDSTPIKMISDPLTFRRKVEQAIEAKQAGLPVVKIKDVE